MVDPSVRPILTLAGHDNMSYNTQKHVTHNYICCYYYKHVEITFSTQDKMMIMNLQE